MTLPIKEIREIYSSIEDQTRRFSEATGLSCPTGCGQCCLSSKVEATVLEALPLAEHLHREGRALEVHEAVSRLEGVQPCIFYSHDPGNPKKGSCSVYPYRPSICRLFGFAAVTDKHGQPRLALCHVHREHDASMSDRAIKHVEAGGEVPRFADESEKVATLYPSLGSRRLPINQAVAEAIEIIGLSLGYASAADGETIPFPKEPSGNGGDVDPENPQPNHPPRRAA